ncbi:MAG: hypothetical protein VXB01_14875, partial [Opitutae bacterium]
RRQQGDIVWMGCIPRNDAPMAEIMRNEIKDSLLEAWDVDFYENPVSRYEVTQFDHSTPGVVFFDVKRIPA